MIWIALIAFMILFLVWIIVPSKIIKNPKEKDN